MDRTYVFNSDGNGSGGSKLDITALLPGMFGGKGLDSNLAAALLSQNRNGFGGQDGWWSIIWLVVIASIFGWNGNGFGGFGGRGGNAIPAELAGNAGWYAENVENRRKCACNQRCQSTCSKQSHSNHNGGNIRENINNKRY